MASIVELPARLEMISVRTEKGLVRKARRDATIMMRDFNELRRLEATETEADQKRSITRLKESITGIQKKLKDYLERALDIIKEEDILQLKEMDRLIENLKLLKNKPGPVQELKREINMLKTYFNKEVQRLDRLRTGGYPVIVKNLGTDEAEILRDLKRATYVERKRIRKRKRGERKIGKGVKKEEDITNEVKDLSRRFTEEEKEINRVLIDDFIVLYDILGHITKEEAKIKLYVGKGFSRTIGGELFNKFEELKKEFFYKIEESYKQSLNLLNLIMRRTA